ncbi:unnamed protein product [Boreogadus saida]
MRAGLHEEVGADRRADTSSGFTLLQDTDSRERRPGVSSDISPDTSPDMAEEACEQMRPLLLTSVSVFLALTANFHSKTVQKDQRWAVMVRSEDAFGSEVFQVVPGVSPGGDPNPRPPLSDPQTGRVAPFVVE